MERQAQLATQRAGFTSGGCGVKVIKSFNASARRFAGAKILFLSLLLCFSLPTLAQEDNPFGVVEGFWFPELTCELGAGWERIIFDWSQHQPTGPDDWHTLNVDDRWLKAANQCGREV